MNERSGEPGGLVDGAAELDGLRHAIRAWVDDGRPTPLTRWLDRGLDPDGVPRRLAIPDWAEGLTLLADAVRARPDGWPDRFDERAEGWFRALLRFSRPGGATAFSAGLTAGRQDLFRFWAGRSGDPGLATVVDWWFPGDRRGRHAPPPLPADARPDRPLASLRANWMKDGDFLAVDHRAAGLETRLELFGLGVPWLGPGWTSGAAEAGGRVSRPRPTLWVSQGSADVVEWSYRVGPARVVRTAVLLRGRKVALIAEQWDGPDDPGETRLALGDGVHAGPSPDKGSRALVLTAPRRRSAQVVPVGLPAADYPTDQGSLTCEGGELVLRQRAPEGARRVWRALVVSWEPRRLRKALRWRALTVAENSRACAPDVAFGARVSWGRDETLFLYRSLTRPSVRACLGHQTRARFLVGLFSPEGEVEPLVKVEE